MLDSADVFLLKVSLRKLALVLSCGASTNIGLTWIKLVKLLIFCDGQSYYRGL